MEIVKVGSLFSGIGGIDLGLERAGMKIVWQVETDEYARQVLKKRWPHVTLYGDIRKIDFTKVEPVDLICGGFPCQSVSCAGKRKGDKDERWLWPDFYRAICEAHPRWVMGENVPGLLSADMGRLFGGILRDLACGGYDAEWDLLPASAFGAPHLRFRLFFIAWKSGNGNRDKWLPKRVEMEMGKPSQFTETNGSNTQRHPIGAGFCPDEQAKERRRRFGNGDRKEDDSNASSERLPERNRLFTRGEKTDSAIKASEWWAVEPDVGRVAHGISSRVDRLKCLGNAVVPQVAEWIGKKIMETAGGDDE